MSLHKIHCHEPNNAGKKNVCFVKPQLTVRWSLGALLTLSYSLYLVFNSWPSVSWRRVVMWCRNTTWIFIAVKNSNLDWLYHINRKCPRLAVRRYQLVSAREESKRTEISRSFSLSPEYEIAPLNRPRSFIILYHGWVLRTAPTGGWDCAFK